MTDPYGPYRPGPPAADDVEYEVVYPPLTTSVPGHLGYGVYDTGLGPRPGPGIAAAPAGVPSGRPGQVTAAGVLALVEAGLLALGTVVWVVLAGTGDGVAAVTPTVLAVLAATAVSALLVVGGLGVLRGTGSRLLTRTTWAELALITSLTLWPVIALIDVSKGGTAAGVLLAGLAGAALPVTRLVLLARPPAPAWLAATASAAPAAVWSPISARWVPPRSAGLSSGALVAVLVPAAVLGMAGALVVGTAGAPSGGTPFAFDPYAPGGQGSGTYAGDSPWGERYYRDGQALPAPPEGSHLFDAEYDAAARECAEGDMYSCDELYWATPVGDFYEWFGSSCGGRVDHELSGGCVDLLGPEVE